MPSLPVRAYTDKLSYEGGDAISVHVSSEVGPVAIRLVRLLNAHPEETDLDRPIDWGSAGTYPASEQETCVGSFAHATVSAARSTIGASAAVGTFVWSGGFSRAGVETVLSTAGVGEGAGLRLTIEGGHVVLAAVDVSGPLWAVSSAVQVRDGTWYFVAGWTAEGRAGVVVEPLDPLQGSPSRDVAEVARLDVSVRSVTIGGSTPSRVERVGRAARGVGKDTLNGKVEAPFVSGRALTDSDIARLVAHESPVTVLGDDLIAAWDFAPVFDTSFDQAGSLLAGEEPAQLVNVPGRGVTGSLFDGSVLDFADAPAQFAAIHFHSTDLYDAGWDSVLTADLPPDLPSGAYGVVVEAGGHRDVVPVAVVPSDDQPRQRIAIILPTFSYLAYANESLFNGLDAGALTDRPISISAEDLAHVGDSSFGLSMYDTHRDGSGVMMSSARRQIVNMRRGYKNWLYDGYRGFSAEMYLIEWAHRQSFDADIITDVELHTRGVDYLTPYDVVISGAHPEYTSHRMLDALRAYRDGGGRIMYLGGNGWYWVTGVYEDDPLLVEIRRGQAGIRCWESLPGEVTLISTGEPGGLWRHRGIAPQKLVGVGMAAQGWGSSAGYRVAADLDPDGSASWILDGVTEDPIGTYGFVMGGAAGDEIDRADVSLGTPVDATVIASSFGHTNFYQRAIEEIPMNLPGHGGGQEDPDVRADIVYFATPGGGEVFSVGSIAWSGSLLWNGCDNDVSRMTANVVRRFTA